MKTTSKFVALGALALAAGLAASSPAYAVRDAGFLPQCPRHEMFGILMGECIPFDVNERVGESRNPITFIRGAPPPDQRHH